MRKKSARNIRIFDISNSELLKKIRDDKGKKIDNRSWFEILNGKWTVSKAKEHLPATFTTQLMQHGSPCSSIRWSTCQP